MTCEQEQRALADDLAGQREHVLDRLLGQDRAAGGDPAEHRDVGRRRAGRPDRLLVVDRRARWAGARRPRAAGWGPCAGSPSSAARPSGRPRWTATRGRPPRRSRARWAGSRAARRSPGCSRGSGAGGRSGRRRRPPAARSSPPRRRAARRPAAASHARRGSRCGRPSVGADRSGRVAGRTPASSRRSSVSHGRPPRCQCCGRVFCALEQPYRRVAR